MDWEKYKIKDYDYWVVSINPNQGYLGRCIFWCKREAANDFCDMTVVEQRELMTICRDLKKTLQNIFQPDRFNYAFLGNGTRHLHCHFIPRYAIDKEFAGLIFQDKLFGHNFQTDENFQTPEKVVQKIKKLIQNELAKNTSMISE